MARSSPRRSLLGVAKSVPLAPLHRLMPWAIVGFGICLVTGFIFVSGNLFKEPMVLFRNIPFQLKMLFVALAGANAATFYLSPVHGAVRGHSLRPRKVTGLDLLEQIGL